MFSDINCSFNIVDTLILLLEKKILGCSYLMLCLMIFYIVISMSFGFTSYFWLGWIYFRRYVLAEPKFSLLSCDLCTSSVFMPAVMSIQKLRACQRVNSPCNCI